MAPQDSLTPSHDDDASRSPRPEQTAGPAKAPGSDTASRAEKAPRSEKPPRPARTPRAHREPEPRPRVLDSLEGSAGQQDPAPPAPPAESADLTTAHYTNPTRRIARRIVQSVFFRGLVNRTIRRINVVDPAAYGVKGTCVVVANHSSHLDAPLVMSGVPRYISRDLATGVAADYFFTAWHKKFFTQLVFNAFPVDRRGEGANKGLSKKLLAAGVPLLIFPEGTRSKTGKMAPFQVGAASLALSVQVPVVPVALIGAHEAMPRGANWPRRGRPPVVVAVGAPLRARGNETARSFNERIEAAVRSLYASNRDMIQD